MKNKNDKNKTINEKKIERATRRVNSIDILPANKKYILRFIEQISAEGITKQRQARYCYVLGRIAVMLGKDFSKATKDDIIKLCSTINKKDYEELPAYITKGLKAHFVNYFDDVIKIVF